MNNKEELKKIGTCIAAAVVAEGVKGLKEVGTNYASNYVKRRNVGFEVICAASGAFYDTRRYYTDILSGRKPRVIEQAIFFDD